MRNYLILFILIITMFAVSCKNSRLDNNPVNPVDDSSIMPLAEGNWWRYEISAFDSVGTQIKMNQNNMTIPMLFTMGHDTTLFNTKCFPMLNFIDDSKTMYWTEKSDGIWASSISNSTKYATAQYPIFKYPVSQNDSYITKDGIIDVISTQESVVITAVSPQQTYNCYHYKIYDAEAIVHFYLAKGIGIVKIEFFGIYEVNSVYRNVKLVYELTSYHLN